MWIKSFAKINPVLKIGTKRKDGFHNLFLMYQTISLHDHLKFDVKSSKHSNIYIECTDNRIPTDNNNLVFKAVELIMNKFHLKLDFNIFIKKNIPPGGGLGGGSSNAAETIKYLNKFLKLNMSKSQMMDLGAVLGSDIPFFIEGGTAAGIGRGEVIIPMRNLPEINFLSVFPGIPFPTGKMYRIFDESEVNKVNNIEVQLVDIYTDTINCFENDFDKVLNSVDVELGNVFNEIKKLGFKVMLSGSGSTFLIFSKNKSLNDAIKCLPKNYKYKKVTTNVCQD